MLNAVLLTDSDVIRSSEQMYTNIIHRSASEKRFPYFIPSICLRSFLNHTLGFSYFDLFNPCWNITLEISLRNQEYTSNQKLPSRTCSVIFPLSYCQISGILSEGIITCENYMHVAISKLWHPYFTKKEYPIRWYITFVFIWLTRAKFWRPFDLKCRKSTPRYKRVYLEHFKLRSVGISILFFISHVFQHLK